MIYEPVQQRICGNCNSWSAYPTLDKNSGTLAANCAFHNKPMRASDKCSKWRLKLPPAVPETDEYDFGYFG